MGGGVLEVRPLLLNTWNILAPGGSESLLTIANQDRAANR